MEQVDVVIIGGGLAGSSCALELARNGARVTLLERTRRPALKVCGDFLSGEALDCLDYLGIDANELGAQSIKRFALSAGSRTVDVILPFRAAGLSRLCLDDTLLARAAANGAVVARGISVAGLRTDGLHATISTKQHTFHARAVALATGKHNLRGWPRPAGTATAFKMQFLLNRATRHELAGSVNLSFYNGGHVGACMVEGGIVTICWQVDTAFLGDFGTMWQKQLTAIANRSPTFAGLFDGARPIQTRPAAVSNFPVGFVHCRPIPENVYPLGDQMAVIPSFTGDGTAIALSTGIRAARAILDGKPASAYRAEFTGCVRRQFALASHINRVMRSRLGRVVGIEASRALPSVVSLLARATRLNDLSVDRSTNPAGL